MAAALAATASIAWLQFFEVFWAPGGANIDPQMVPGGVKIELWRVPEGSWKLLGTSGGVLGGAAGIPEGSGSRLEGLLGPNGSHFGSLLGLLFGTFFGAEFGMRFYIDFCLIFH